jgi:hypothetical protein
MARIAARHARTLQDLACVRRLRQLDAIATLTHLSAKIKAE